MGIEGWGGGGGVYLREILMGDFGRLWGNLRGRDFEGRLWGILREDCG